MADLNVQPKRSKPIWPWILVALIIAAVIYFLSREPEVVKDVIPGTSDTTDTTNQYRSSPNP